MNKEDEDRFSIASFLRRSIGAFIFIGAAFVMVAEFWAPAKHWKEQILAQPIYFPAAFICYLALHLVYDCVLFVQREAISAEHKRRAAARAKRVRSGRR